MWQLCLCVCIYIYIFICICVQEMNVRPKYAAPFYLLAVP